MDFVGNIMYTPFVGKVRLFEKKKMKPSPVNGFDYCLMHKSSI